MVNTNWVYSKCKSLHPNEKMTCDVNPQITDAELCDFCMIDFKDKTSPASINGFSNITQLKNWADGQGRRSMKKTPISYTFYIGPSSNGYPGAQMKSTSWMRWQMDKSTNWITSSQWHVSTGNHITNLLLCLIGHQKLQTANWFV